MSCLLLLALLFVAAQAQAPPAPPSKPHWGAQFDAAFGLYSPVNNFINFTSHFYYNWDLKATLITYPERCLPTFNISLPCNLTFTPTGCFVTFPLLPTCLLFPGVGSIPPNFLAPFDYVSSTVSLDLFGNARYANYWVAPNATSFQYWTDAASGEDIQFLDGGNVLWTFGPLTDRPQDKGLFSVPSPAVACPTELFHPELEASLPFAGLSKLHKQFNPIH
eukprot:TRINITY_DN1568_c0_g1_i1.p1 TRINITY_DN1568_c0_g1~~TRINITY_DN1568_c0_g1_i1.p1  ORF type:complete len:220 (-),score=53.29 TRINITY_DN1568_c0_g1_i1:41-700(-)